MAKRKQRSTSKKSTRKATRKTAARRPAPRKAARKNARRPARSARPRAARKTAKAKVRAKKAAPRPTARRAKKPAAVQSRRPKPVALQRERRRLEEPVVIPSPPSSFNFTSKASSAESGRASMRQHRQDHPEAGPSLTAGDLDADWEDAYSDGDEAPGGDNPTPDQDVVEEIGRALGVEYDDAEELKGADKIIERDRHRWEYNPASSDDYKDRNKE